MEPLRFGIGVQVTVAVIVPAKLFELVTVMAGIAMGVMQFAFKPPLQAPAFPIRHITVVISARHEPN